MFFLDLMLFARISKCWSSKNIQFSKLKKNSLSGTIHHYPFPKNCALKKKKMISNLKKKIKYHLLYIIK